jgi:hypothetical protein
MVLQNGGAQLAECLIGLGGFFNDLTKVFGDIFRMLADTLEGGVDRLVASLGENARQNRPENWETIRLQAGRRKDSARSGPGEPTERQCSMKTRGTEYCVTQIYCGEILRYEQGVHWSAHREP